MKGMNVYINGEYRGFIYGQSERIRRKAIERLVTSTHMGEWHKTEKGPEMDWRSK